ncbi:MAG TPA: hypothetical protein VLX92_33540, partial [Kofleriaceae bacterium]|nr:hypothetical protein [Kofleriaceae bacterium]
MRDLELWRRLAAGTAGADELAPLAAHPLGRRGPFVGPLVALATHAEPAVRIAALRALAGARGTTGVRAI